MPFNFDLEAGTNQIATIERAITATLPSTSTLSPTTVYDYNEEPNQVQDSDLPAILHIQRFPGISDTAPPGGEIANGYYSAQVTIESVFLVLEAIPEADQFMDAFGITKAFAIEIYNAFFNRTNYTSLVNAMNAIDYQLRFPDAQQTVGIRAWPPVGLPQAQKQYWSYSYLHYFKVEGCNT